MEKLTLLTFSEMLDRYFDLEISLLKTTDPNESELIDQRITLISKHLETIKSSVIKKSEFESLCDNLYNIKLTKFNVMNEMMRLDVDGLAYTNDFSELGQTLCELEKEHLDVSKTIDWCICTAD